MSKRITDKDLELLSELGVETTPAPPVAHSPHEQRIIAGFEEVERFVEQQSRLPQHGEDCDIFERLYAVRLDRMRESDKCREVLAPLDKHGLLSDTALSIQKETQLSDEELLESLGVGEGVGEGAEDDLTKLVHVRPHAEVKAAEEVAQRTPCPDFDLFQSLFQEVQKQLESGERQSVKYKDNAEIRQGDWFIVEGQKALVAEMGEPFVSDYGRLDRRLRVIYDNATQSDLLLRSLQRALNRDRASRRITAPNAARNLSLFEDKFEDNANDAAPTDSVESDHNGAPAGTIYVLRSQSEHPFIAENRSLIHKIGVTGGDVQIRIANAAQDPTFLLADVELIATFQLENMNRHKLETLLHRFFSSARLDLELIDRFEIPVKPREWFMVSLKVIEKVVEKINDDTLHQFHYDAEMGDLRQNSVIPPN